MTAPTDQAFHHSAAQSAMTIENDEESVRLSGAGRGRLLDDLHQVTAEEVHNVFNAVSRIDKAKAQPTVIDISNNQLVIADAFAVPVNSSNADGLKVSGDAGGNNADPKAVVNELPGQLKVLQGAWHQLPWYERFLAAGTAYRAAQLGNTILEGVIDELAADNKNPGSKSPLQQQRQQLQAEIAAHQKMLDHRSWLESAVAAATQNLWHSEDETLFDLKQAKQSAELESTSDLIVADQKALQKSERLDKLACEVIKAVPLFMGGGKATLAYAILSAVDQAQVGSALSTQLVDLGLGAAKGLAMKGLFNKVGGMNMAIAARGVTLSMGARVLDTALTRETYLDRTTGDVDLTGGLANILYNTFDVTSLAAGAVTFVAVGGVTRGLNLALGSEAASNPFWSTVITAGTMGAAQGAVSEALNERAHKEEFDFRKIAAWGLAEGGLYGLAAVPGGMQRYSFDKLMDDFDNAGTELERQNTLRKLRIIKNTSFYGGRFFGDSQAVRQKISYLEEANVQDARSYMKSINSHYFNY